MGQHPDAPAIPEDPHWADPRTFYLEPELWQEPFQLQGQEAHHLTKVLRIRAGEDIRLLDGQGREGLFRVLTCERQRVRLERLRDWTRPLPASRVILAAGWTKAARRGWLLEKAVEFEASGIWLWQAERSQFPVPEGSRENWQAQLVAGAKQCRNPWLPEVRTFPGGLDELLRDVDAENPVQRHILLEKTCGPALPLEPERLGLPGLTVCLVGPEGGFAPAEVATALRSGFVGYTLGDRVLRWESAAMFCLGLHWWKRQLDMKHEEA